MRYLSYGFAALIAISATNASAQSRRPASSDWNVSVGLAPVYSPVFEGSDDYALSVFPDLRVRYKDDFFASVPEGMGYNIINEDGIKAGPLVKIRFGRSEEDGGSPFLVTGESRALRGLGDVSTAGEAGGFFQYTAHSLSLRTELRQGFGGHTGWLWDNSLNYNGNSGPVRYSFGPRLSFAGQDYVNTYFGIDANQSARSGLGTYRNDGGLASYGFGASAMIPVSDTISVTAFTGYTRLADNLADSPLVRSRGSANQFTLGLGVGYRFNPEDVTLPNIF